MSSHRVSAFSFSQNYTEEQNKQAHRRWWPLPLPLPRREGEWLPRYPYKEDVRLDLLSYWLSCRGNLTYYAPPCGGGVGGGATILRAQTVRKKPPWTLYALWEIILPSELLMYHLIEWVHSLSHRFTQKNRTHRVSQRPCGRQIAQNITPIFSSNVLWILYAGGVLWVRNSAQICSVKSVRSVREKTPQQVS